MGDNDYMATQKEAADFLKVSTKSISRYRKRGLPYKLVLNPVSGKQEVRFRYADLERWDTGRQLLATYARDGEETAGGDARSSGGQTMTGGTGAAFLDDLLLAYKQQIELLREQLEDMREQLARRDRQIDDLMRLMTGLQLEYKPLPAVPAPVEEQETGVHPEEQATDIYEAVVLPTVEPEPAWTEAEHPVLEPLRLESPKVKPPKSGPVGMQKTFSWEQLSTSIRHLRRKGKSYEEIARGLNQIKVATPSGHPEWTVPEVQALLPRLVTPAPGEDFC
ncbi:MAG: helix-turn-helix domain-containing protein [Proteobacteria bacterium]|nr:helix-turn-helix domain-containing protein [Pseudomonadota bacterium]